MTGWWRDGDGTVTGRSRWRDKNADSAVPSFLEFTPEQKEIFDVAKKFTRDEIVPVAAQHDKTGEVRISNIIDIYKKYIYLNKTPLSQV